MPELKTCEQVIEPVREVAINAKPSSNGVPMEFFLLESSDTFPEGRAAAAALRLLGRGLVEAKANVTVLLPKPGGVSARGIVNPYTGIYKGMRFEFTSGTAMRSPNFLIRRRDAVRGHLVLWARIIKKRMERGPKGVCVFLFGEAPSLCLPVLVLGKLFGFPVIVELCEWKPSFPEATRLGNWYHKLRVRLAEGVLAISDDLERKAAALLPASRKQNVLLHPILVDANEAIVENPQPPIVQAPYLMWCGQALGYFESVVFLIRCYSVARKQLEGLKLALVGPINDVFRQKLRAEIAAAGLTEEQVIITGYVSREQLWSLYAGAIALLAPLDDSERSRARFPWKIAEYLAAGRPVITSNVGEIPRYFTDGENALVAQPDDEADFISKIELVLKNPELADRIGASGRQLALRVFHYGAFGETFLQFVNGVTQRGQTELAREHSV